MKVEIFIDNKKSVIKITKYKNKIKKISHYYCIDDKIYVFNHYTHIPESDLEHYCTNTCTPLEVSKLKKRCKSEKELIKKIENELEEELNKLQEDNLSHTIEKLEKNKKRRI